MNPLNFIPRWALTAAVAVLATTSCTLKYGKDGLELELSRTRVAAAEREAAYQAQVAIAEQDLREVTERVRTTEQQLVVQTAQIQEQANEQIRVVSATADSLRRRLRDTEARSRAALATQASPSDPTPPAPAFELGSVGALVSGQAGDLVGEALRAETIRLNLIQCYEQYDAAEQALRALAPDP